MNKDSLKIEERIKIKELLDPRLELSLSFIAKQMGRSKTCVGKEIRQNGGRYKYDPQVAHKAALDRHKLMGVLQRAVSPEVEIQVKEALLEKNSITYCMLKYGLTRDCVRNIRTKFGIFFWETEETSLEGRMCALEMQVEILIEQIRNQK